LKLGDQVLVKVLAIEGNKIRLSRKALIKEARERQAHKQGQPTAGTPTPAGTTEGH
jgi:polyribonucleotide nucleotidyltransferase